MSFKVGDRVQFSVGGWLRTGTIGTISDGMASIREDGTCTAFRVALTDLTRLAGKHHFGDTFITAPNGTKQC